METLLSTLKGLDHALVGCMSIGNGQYVVLATPLLPAGHKYVTWVYANGGCSWGHYLQDRGEAVADFVDRWRGRVAP